MRNSTKLTLVALTTLILAIGFLAGCKAFSTQAEKDQALATNESQLQTVTQAQATAAQNLALAQAAHDDAQALRLKQEMDLNKAMLVGLQAQHETIDKTPVGQSWNWGAGLGVLGGLLPPPFNGIALLGSLALAGLQTKRQGDAVAVSHAIVNAHDTAAAADPAFKDALAKVTPVINAELAKVNNAHEFVSTARS